MRRLLPLLLFALLALADGLHAQTFSGSLQTADATLQSGEYVDTYEVRARAGQTITATLTSSDFDTYLFIKSPSGEQEDNDDCTEGETTRSCVTMTADQTGTYRFIVTSFATGETGAYRLDVAVGAAAPTSRPGPSTAGTRTQGRLQSGDATLQSGEYVDTHTVQVAPGQALTVTVSSSDFDTYVMVNPPAGDRGENDDCTDGETTRSCVAMPAGQGGSYEILVTSYEAGETGAYTLETSTGGSGGGGGSGDQVFRGALSTDDDTDFDGEFVDTYPIRLAAGQTITATVTSDDFDTWVLVRPPSGDVEFNDDCTEGETTRSCLTYTATAAGQYDVRVTSYAVGETGSYVLTVSGDDGGGTVRPSDPVPSAGDVTRGTLASGDVTLRSGEYVDTHRVQVQAGQTLSVEVASSDFDTYVMVKTPDGEQEDNDDCTAGDTSRSCLDVMAERSGTYEILVTSFEPGETGVYTLTTSTDGGSDGAVTQSGARFESGMLASGDATLRTGEFADGYSFVGTGGPMIVELTSDDFDTYLIVAPPEGEQFDNDDYEGATNRSLITLQTVAGETYRVTVTSFQAGESGAYDLTIRGEEGGGASLASGVRRETGRLDGSDEKLRSGEFVDTYSFQGVPGQRIRLDLTSDEFDTFLLVQPPRGEAVQDDDGGGRPGHSRVEMDLTEPGTYQVFVTSYAADETGAYQLAMDFSERFGQPENTPAPRTDQAEVLYRPTTRNIDDWTLAETIPGRLTASSQRTSDGKYIATHTFDGDAGEPVRIELTSSDFDTYLLVTSPSGEQVSNDDYEGSQNQSVVEFTMQESGRYRIVVTSYREGEVGPYTLRLTQTDAMLPEPPAFDRMVGVFVGISDYSQRGIGNLRWTADDAETVRNAMISAGMNPADAILLQDNDATVGAVEGAIAQLARRSDERTLFVFFYSGHGGQYDRTSFQREDPDNKDESLELADGYILDDRFDELLTQLPSARQLIVLDACFSGGFAKDVISRPGRMGLFSSDEDVVSQVAIKFEAGGYLSQFFSDAVALGQADEDRNGAVTALELSQYVHTRYREDVRGTGRELIVARDTRLDHQKLVVDRGSVGLYDTLFLMNR
jgi:hypothetical protein